MVVSRWLVYPHPMLTILLLPCTLSPSKTNPTQCKHRLYSKILTLTRESERDGHKDDLFILKYSAGATWMFFYEHYFYITVHKHFFDSLLWLFGIYGTDMFRFLDKRCLKRKYISKLKTVEKSGIWKKKYVSCWNNHEV